MKKNVLVLASGGIDSTACIQYYIQRGFQVQILHVDYGQKPFEPERAALHSVCEYFDLEYQLLTMRGIPWSLRHFDEIVGRNLFLAAIGLATFHANSGLVAMGIHSGNEYADCSREFQNQLRVIAQLSSRYLIDFDFPFGTWFKHEIIEYCRSHEIPVWLTYSCVTSESDACGQCDSCLERRNYVDKQGYLYE